MADAKSTDDFTIPCELDKCLKYPACQTKRIIHCNDLLRFYRNICYCYDGSAKKSQWNKIRETLPMLDLIKKEKS